MQFFKLGKQKISRICLGTWSLGGDSKGNISYGNMNNKKAQEILEYAYEKKINFFDTANVYGNAEKRIGLFLKTKKRKNIFVGTKIGCFSFNKKKNFSTKSISNQIISSIKNLNDSYVDLVQLYGPNPQDKNISSTIEKLYEFKEKKLIKNIGISLQSPIDYLQFRKKFKFDFVQCNFNLLDTRIMQNKIFEFFQKDKVKFFARTVLNFGIFTEEFLKNKANLSQNDHRKKWNSDQINSWCNNIEIIKKIIPGNIEDISYKFCNSFNFCGLIVGSTEKKHIDIATMKSNLKSLKKTQKEIILKLSYQFDKRGIKKPHFIMKS